MEIIDKIFNVNTEPRPWYRIVLWWELRRILYNILLLLFGIISLTINSYIIQGFWDFFSPPIFSFILFGLFIFLANGAYTLGWIFQLITRNTSNDRVKKLTPRLLKIGIYFSLFVTFIPCLSSGLYTIISGERIKSIYANRTTERPEEKDLVGIYYLSEESMKQSKLDDKDYKNSTFTLFADSTFEIKNYPHQKFDDFFGDLVKTNANGTWEIYKYKNRPWKLSISFKSIIFIESGDSLKTFGTSFDLKNNEPPYEIYEIIGDPDSWEGLLYKKNKN